MLCLLWAGLDAPGSYGSVYEDTWSEPRWDLGFAQEAAGEMRGANQCGLQGEETYYGQPGEGLGHVLCLK